MAEKRRKCLHCGMTDEDTLFRAIPGAGWIHNRLEDCSKASERPTKREQAKAWKLKPELRAWGRPQMADVDPDDHEQIVERHSQGGY